MSKEASMYGIAAVAIIILLAGAGYFFYNQIVVERQIQMVQVELDMQLKMQRHLEEQYEQINKRKQELPKDDKSYDEIKKQIDSELVDIEKRLQEMKEAHARGTEFLEEIKQQKLF